MTRAPRFAASTFLAASLALAGCGATVTSGQQTDDAGADSQVTPDTMVVWDVPPPDVTIDRVSVRDVPPPDVPVARDVPVVPDAPTCGFSGAEGVVISFREERGAALDCSVGRPTPGVPPAVSTRNAAVIDVVDDATGSTLTLDFCSPAFDCVPRIGTLRITAPRFNLGATPVRLRQGQYVTVRSRATWSWGCTMQVEVSNAPSWDRFANPVRTDSALLFAASSGEASTLPGAPFQITRQSIGCAMSGPNCGGGVPELFALSAQGRCNTCESDPPPVTVFQGRTEMIGINHLEYAVRNHRSFNTGACDDYWNYAWTAREVWLE